MPSRISRKKQLARIQNVRRRYRNCVAAGDLTKGAGKALDAALGQAERYAHRLKLEEQLIKLSAEGSSVSAIAKKLKLSEGYVVQLRAKLGLGNSSAKKTVKDIRMLNAMGLRDQAIAQKLGMSRAHVCVLRNRHGILPVR
ncbi:hypothetical protein [Pontixanthobacter sp.]|uniref:hypothetical protein n=1 Tax=Pontixanthobacter sp. TaxID=2792078 RepID=UPI003C7BF1D3